MYKVFTKGLCFIEMKRKLPKSADGFRRHVNMCGYDDVHLQLMIDDMTAYDYKRLLVELTCDGSRCSHSVCNDGLCTIVVSTGELILARVVFNKFYKNPSAEVFFLRNSRE